MEENCTPSHDNLSFGLLTFILYFLESVPHFQEGSYLAFKPMITDKNEFYAKLDLIPETANGLILYSGSANDFISLALRGGRLEMRLVSSFCAGGGGIFSAVVSVASHKGPFTRVIFAVRVSHDNHTANITRVNGPLPTHRFFPRRCFEMPCCYWLFSEAFFLNGLLSLVNFPRRVLQ